MRDMSRMTTVETVVSFEAAHRLYDVNTYSKECRDSVHGHSYKVKLVATRSSVLDSGMIIDFKLFKKIAKEIIHDTYDHSIILRETDPLVKCFAEVAPEQHINVVSESPTAEWMARVFCYSMNDALQEVDRKLEMVSVSVQETENNIATFIR